MDEETIRKQKEMKINEAFSDIQSDLSELIDVSTETLVQAQEYWFKREQALLKTAPTSLSTETTLMILTGIGLLAIAL